MYALINEYMNECMCEEGQWVPWTGSQGRCPLVRSKVWGDQDMPWLCACRNLLGHQKMTGWED